MLKSLRQLCSAVLVADMLLLSVVSCLRMDWSCLLKDVLTKAGDLRGVPSSQNPSLSLTPIGNDVDFDFLCE